MINYLMNIKSVKGEKVSYWKWSK